MSAVIVDDEPLARLELRRLLRAQTEVDVEIVGEADHVEAGLAVIARTRPDVLLLDIEMPGATGFDLLARLEWRPHVIFTTAYDRHAVRAFAVDAVHYLLKPVAREALEDALRRVSREPEGRHAPADEHLFVRERERAWLIPIREIRLLTSEGDYVQVFWNDVAPLASDSLSNVEARLNPTRFVRGNRRQIFNLAFVEHFENVEGGRIRVALRGGETVLVSRRQAKALRATLATVGAHDIGDHER